MNIIVCVKQVPDTTEVRIDPVTGTLIRDGVPSIINPDDKSALEAALALKDNDKDIKVVVVSMGPPQADVAMREALAMGADEAYLISGREYGGSDTWATSNIISEGIKYISGLIGGYDIVMCGRQAIDGDTAQVGPQIAERLDLPQITYVQDLKVEGDTITAQRALEDGYQVIEVKKPALITCLKELNEPRYANMGGIFDAYAKEVKIISQAELNVPAEKIGLKSSPTNVKKSFAAGVKGAGVVLQGSAKEVTEQLVENLKAKHII